MDYRVVPSIWRAGNHVYKRGDVVPEAMLARLGPVSSWRRLGLIVPVDAPDPKPTVERAWWDGLTKTQLLAQAQERGFELDQSRSKRQLVEQLKEDPDGV